MSYNFKKIFASVIFVLFFLSFPFLKDKQSIFADDLQDQIDKITKQIADLQAAIDPLKTESTDLSKKITSAKSQISQISAQINNLNKRLNEKETELDTQQKLLGERVKRYYKSSKKFSPLMIFLANQEGLSLLQQYTLYQSVISQDKTMITQYTSDINSLNKNKTELETETSKLASLKKTLEDRFSFLSQEITKAENYKSELTENLKQLEAKRLASLGLPTTTGSGISCVDDRNIDPSFGTGFAFFTFGIPHHVGLNQYGAYGRAKAGQSTEDILDAYYNNVQINKNYDTSIKIHVVGCYSSDSRCTTKDKCQDICKTTWVDDVVDIETYVKRIYEIPSDWGNNGGMNALEAQAIAARSYALAYTNNGSKEICPSQSCQVYKSSNKGGNWETASNNTRGQVLIQNGNVISAYFASTAGGYTITSSDANWNSTGWTKRLRDTSGDVNSLDDLKNKAYDKDSPCFYSAQGYRKEYNKSAWLKPAEVADIVNVILLSQKDSSVNNNLSPIDQGGWSMDKVKEELKNRGGSVCNNVNSTSQSFDFNGGKTTQVSFSCDTGNYSFDGSTFKSYFNARAPANIAIVGPLYNVEKR